MTQSEFKQGEYVCFDVNGSKEVYYGRVTRIIKGQPMIQPDVNLSPRAQISNIRKVVGK